MAALLVLLSPFLGKSFFNFFPITEIFALVYFWASFFRNLQAALRSVGIMAALLVLLSPFLGKSFGSFLPNPRFSFHSFICSSLKFLCLLQASINLLTPLAFFCFFLSILPTSKSSLPNWELLRNSAKTSFLLFPP